MRARTAVFLLLCLAGFASGTKAKTETIRPLDLFALGAPSFVNFSARDGLPETIITDVVVDRAGFVWAASPAGIFRYDGHRWHPSDVPFMREAIRTLMLDPDGTLWAAFGYDGLARHDGTRWQIEHFEVEQTRPRVRNFATTRSSDGKAAFWALTLNRGLMRYQHGQWKEDSGNAELPHDTFITMAQTHRIDGQQRQWIGTANEGLWFRDLAGDSAPSTWQRYGVAGLHTGQVSYLLRTEHRGHEELWITVFGTRVMRLRDDGNVRQWSPEAGDLPSNRLYNFAETPLPNGERAIWASSRSGLMRIYDDQMQIFGRSHGLSHEVLRSVSSWRSPSGEQVLWLATEAGVSRVVIGARQWSTASLLGAQATGVFGLLIEPDGSGGERLWVGSTQDGIGLFEHGRWRYLTQANGALPSTGVRTIVAANDEHDQRALWVGQYGGQLLRVRDGPVFEPVDTPWGKIASEAPTTLLARRVGGEYEQWIGTLQSGIFRKRGNRWTAFRAEGVVGTWRIAGLQEQVDDAGRSWLWATTNQGLARFDGERWRLFGSKAGMPGPFLLAQPFFDPSQERTILWVGTVDNGIQRINISDPENPLLLDADLPVPPDLTAYGALRDSKGRLYICTDNGVQQLTPKTGGWSSHVFNRKDGMLHDECNANAQLIDAYDRFWTGTLGGLTVYDPNSLARDDQPKPLKLIGMLIDEQRVNGAVLHIQPSTRNVSIEYALLSWQRESESRFRTQLLGYEVAPGEWTDQHSRTFNALPSGRYVLRIEARDYNGNLSTPIELPLIVAARWWQQLWVLLLAALALLLLCYAAVLWRTRTLERKRQDLELRVAKRTTELNQANALLLELSYVDALTGLANRRRLLETLDNCPCETRTGERNALIVIDVDDFKLYNDRYGHPAGDEALRGVATVMRRCVPADALAARYGGEEFAVLLPGRGHARAAELAETLRAAVAELDITLPDSSQTRRVTISAGVASASLADAADAQRLLRDADAALYEAKRNGKNRVSIAPQAINA